MQMSFSFHSSLLIPQPQRRREKFQRFICSSLTWDIYYFQRWFIYLSVCQDNSRINCRGELKTYKSHYKPWNSTLKMFNVISVKFKPAITDFFGHLAAAKTSCEHTDELSPFKGIVWCFEKYFLLALWLRVTWEDRKTLSHVSVTHGSIASSWVA